MTMPFTEEDKVLIKHYRLKKKYGRKKWLKEYPEKNLSETSLRKLLNKIEDARGTKRKQNKAVKNHKLLDQMQMLTLLKT